MASNFVPRGQGSLITTQTIRYAPQITQKGCPVLWRKNSRQEPKLLTIYAVDSQGKRVNTAELSVTNDGTFGNVEPFMELLEMHLVRLGINQAKQVLLVADGAEWIWQRIPPLLQHLGCPPESFYQLLDFYHATEHLQTFADAAFTQPTERKAWFQQARCDLKREKIVDLLDKMQALRKDSCGERREGYDLPNRLLH